MASNPLRELTDCSICYSPLLEPKILQCGHTFCFECVKRLCDASTNHIFECPECRAINTAQHHQFPTDFKLKQVVEMMHKMCKDQKLDGQSRQNKICSSCGSCGDIQNYFICETCQEDELVRVYCSLCIVKKHQSHTVKEALDEAKLSTSHAIDGNMEKINHIMHNAEFYRKRYEHQNQQIAFVFRLFLNFCEQTKESIKKDFGYEHARLAEVLSRFLDTTHSDINRVFNESDNCIYHLCTTILTTFEQSFNIPQNAMEQLKAKIMNSEDIDLFAFLFNLPKDDLPNLDQRPSSSITNPAELTIYNDDAFSRPNVQSFSPSYLSNEAPSSSNVQLSSYPNNLIGNPVQQSPSNLLGYGQKIYRKKKR